MMYRNTAFEKFAAVVLALALMTFFFIKQQGTRIILDYIITLSVFLLLVARTIRTWSWTSNQLRSLSVACIILTAVGFSYFMLYKEVIGIYTMLLAVLAHGFIFDRILKKRKLELRQAEGEPQTLDA